MNKEEFIKKAKEVHGETTYDYTRVVYLNLKTKVEILCHKHGPFLQSPDKHLYRKQGCTKCGIERNIKNRSSTAEKFIEKSKAVHGERYDYSKVNYINNSTKVEIICPIHGSFWQGPTNHFIGKNGCPECANVTIASKLTLNYHQFIEEANKTHGDKYSYEEVTANTYKSVTDKVKIICPEHGGFWQTPISHKGGAGCPKCGDERSKTSRLLTLDNFIEKAKVIHGDTYDYSKSKYINSHTNIEVICKKHGSFWQMANNHIVGQGCPKCSSNTSPGEKEVLEYIRNLGFRAKKEKLGKYEIDIYVPEKNLGIEYNGLYWHREEMLGKTYHLNKTKACAERGIRLIHIFEDEWVTKKKS